MNLSDFAERLFAGRWIAGPQMADAMRISHELNSHNIGAILNYMGEELTDEEAVEKNVHQYLELIKKIEDERLKAEISVKPTQLGLKISAALLESNYKRITDEALRRGVFVWLDMESHNTVDSTISLYLRQRRNGHIGICIQSYLRRSEADVKRIAARGGIIRLVKGAYSEGSDIAFSSREETTQNYLRLMRIMFQKMDTFMIATHDSSIITEARRLSRRYKKRPEYAMLKGVRNNYAKMLASNGENVSLYVPFGREWIPYTYRRLKEWDNLKLIIRSMFDNQELR